MLNETCPDTENETYLTELRKRYKYVDRSTDDSFPEVHEPIIDLDGLIRGKNKSLHSGEEVSIIESSDLKKIQEDILMVETAYCDKSEQFNLMEKKMDKRHKKWKEIRKNNGATVAKLEEMMCVLHGNNANQSKEIQDLIGTVKDRDRTITVLQSENNRLKKAVGKKDRIIAEKDRTIAQQNHNEIEAMQEIRFTWKKPKPGDVPEEARWHDRNTSLGILHTFCDIDYPREKQENDLRRYAYEGNISRLNKLLSSDKTLVNGRGMPDSFGSTLRSWWDKTPLILASQQGHKECVEMLVKNGAHVNYLDRDKKTALDYAEINEHEEVECFLKEHHAENGRHLKHIFEQVTIEMR